MLSFSAMGQAPEAAVELTDMNVLYRGYPSKIAVGVTNNGKSKVKLECINCDTLYKINSNEYVLKPGKAERTIIQVLLQKGKKSKVIDQVEYSVRNLPDPTLFWGNVKDGNKAQQTSRGLQVRYAPDIPLRASFAVLEWTITVNGKNQTGVGSNLDRADDLIKSAQEGDFIIIEASVRCPDFVIKKITGVFTI